jgi:hypothetical protein
VGRYTLISFVSNYHTYVFPFSVRPSPQRPLDKLIADIKNGVAARYPVQEYDRLDDADVEQRLANLLHLPRLHLHLHLLTQTQLHARHIEEREVPIFKGSSGFRVGE